LDKKSLIIYEIFPRVYSEEGDFRGVIKNLSRIKSLGVNTIWLMPIYPIGRIKRKGELGSPYAVMNHYAINPEYGTKEDLRKLVSEVHKYGMYIIIDWETNYTAWDHCWIEEHPEWYAKDENGNIILPNAEWWDVARLDFKNDELVEEMVNAMKYWLKEFDIDGYRCDMAGDMVGRDPKEYWEYVRSELEKVKKDIIMLAEWDDPKLHPAFDFCYDWKLYTLFKDILHYRKSPFEIFNLLDEEKKIYPFASRLRFTENHDERRCFEIFGKKYGKIFTSLIFMLDGIPLIYNAQEIGAVSHPPLFDRFTINWRNVDEEIFSFFKRIIKIRNEKEVLRKGTYRRFEEENVFGFYRESEDERILYLANFQYKRIKINIKGYELFKEKEVDGVELDPFNFSIIEV